MGASPGDVVCSAANAPHAASPEFGSFDDGLCTGEASVEEVGVQTDGLVSEGDTHHTYMGFARGVGVAVSSA